MEIKLILNRLNATWKFKFKFKGIATCIDKRFTRPKHTGCRIEIRWNFIDASVNRGGNQVKLGLEVGIEYNNLKLMAWEPFIEPWRVQLIANIPKETFDDDNKPVVGNNAGLKLQVALAEISILH